MNTTTLVGFLCTCLGGYFAIMNPIANTPVFISLTQGDDAATKKAVARNSLLFAFALIAVLSFAGNFIFKLFGITQPALQITGGIIIFIIGYHMLQGSGSKVHTPSDDDIESSRKARLNVAISPLGIPILAGPGTIAVAMGYAAGFELIHVILSLLAFGVICGITYLCFRGSEEIVEHLGQNGLNVITRLMGLFLAAIGTGMILSGLGADIHTFMGSLS